MRSGRDAIAVFAALAAYRLGVVPPVRRQLRGWEGAAARIPDPVLRAHALDGLRAKGDNAEATAVFALLAPRRARATAIRAMTAFQVAVDYLDTLGEEPVPDPLRNGLRLHRALVDALDPRGPGDPSGPARRAAADWYGLNPQREDGGYLAALVSTCREAVAQLPAADAALPVARRAAQRCGEGQSHTHAAELSEKGGDDRAGAQALEDWALSLAGPTGYPWWELAAGASSSAAAHALIAAAADPRATAGEAELIDAAYFPPIGALTVLLDDLVDLEADRAAGTHSYLSYYPSNLAAADRLAFIAARATAAVAKLRRRRMHGAILAGVAGYYLSAPSASTSYARPIRDRLLEVLGPAVRPILAAGRLIGTHTDRD